MKKHLFIILALMCNLSVFAGYRAGEITYSRLTGLTYEVTLKIYTDTVNSGSNPQTLSWGDGTTDTISLTGGSYILDSSIVCKTYVGTHTYAGVGTYNISFEGLNRNSGISNIPNSINVPFYIESQIVINAFLGANSSPTFLNPAIVVGFVDSALIYNSAAFDTDGDSISYKLVECRGEGGISIPGYTFPPASNLFALDSVTGDLLWDSPLNCGDYNIAMLVEEWRQGIKIGYITREIQIIIDCNNSINENNPEQNNYYIFPNPAHDYFTIKQEHPTNKNIIVEFLDMTGKLICKENFENELSLNIGQIAKGIYMLRLTNDNSTLIKKIIKE